MERFYFVIDRPIVFRHDAMHLERDNARERATITFESVSLRWRSLPFDIFASDTDTIPFCRGSSSAQRRTIRNFGPIDFERAAFRKSRRRRVRAASNAGVLSARAADRRGERPAVKVA